MNEIELVAVVTLDSGVKYALGANGELFREKEQVVIPAVGIDRRMIVAELKAVTMALASHDTPDEEQVLTDFDEAIASADPDAIPAIDTTPIEETWAWQGDGQLVARKGRWTMLDGSHQGLPGSWGLAHDDIPMSGSWAIHVTGVRNPEDDDRFTREHLEPIVQDFMQWLNVQRPPLPEEPRSWGSVALVNRNGDDWEVHRSQAVGVVAYFMIRLRDGRESAGKSWAEVCELGEVTLLPGSYPRTHS